MKMTNKICEPKDNFSSHTQKNSLLAAVIIRDLASLIHKLPVPKKDLVSIQ